MAVIDGGTAVRATSNGVVVAAGLSSDCGARGHLLEKTWRKWTEAEEGTWMGDGGREGVFDYWGVFAYVSVLRLNATLFAVVSTALLAVRFETLTTQTRVHQHRIQVGGGDEISAAS